ncbi:MAG: hypothetical protein KGY81_10000 [Phycisphaerae bacterium]|jgi:hypothetical protein|nr:hypothetical protein [Phycisphaerae bacterium]
MFEQSLLREQFESLLNQQQQAIGHYESASAHDGLDADLRSQLADVCREKKRHIELTQRLIEILD